MVVTFGRLMALRVLEPPPVIVEPVGVMERPLTVTEPAPVLASVKLMTWVLSLLVDDEYVCEKVPDDKVSLPEVSVKFLPEATVVLPFKVTLPEPVWNEPVEDD